MTHESFISIARAFKSKHQKEEDQQYEGAEFGWFRHLSSPRQKGKAAREMVGEWMGARFDGVEKVVGSGKESSRHGTYYFFVEGVGRIAVRSSTLHSNPRKGEDKKFVFNQIRDEDYDFLFCLGIAPSDVHAWLIPKCEIYSSQRMEGDGVKGQHTGKDAKETLWLWIAPDDPQGWLSQWGGTLEKVERVMENPAGIEDS